jgi:hypothetical protein
MSEAIVLKTTALKIKDYFQGTKARKDFFAGEELVEYDCDQLLTFEARFATHQFMTRGTGDGLPPMSVLVATWRRARDSFERVLCALPAGALRDAMEIELAARDASMDRLADQAREMIATKLANGEVDG